MAEVTQPHVKDEMSIGRVRSDASLGSEEWLAWMMKFKAGIIRARLRRTVLLLGLSAIGCLIAVLMAGSMLLAITEATYRGDYNEVQTGANGSHGLAVLMLVLMSALTLAWGMAVFSPAVALRVRGSLEYTILMILNSQRGQHYKYAKVPVESGNAEEAMQRELHQLKFEAGLTGWSEEVLEEQLSKVETAYAAHEPPARKSLLLKKEVSKLISMVQHTVGAMPVVLAVASIIVAVVVVGVGAMGGTLAIGFFHMPNEDDDQWAIEYCWQTLNFIFTFVAIFKGPGRIKVCYHLWKHDYEEVIDGIPCSLMIPGVLAKRREVVNIATLRLTNFLAQYVINYFMWAWFPQCNVEVQETNKECASRVPVVVPVFVLIAACSDIASTILLHNYIVNCKYLLWPTLSSSGAVLVAASCKEVGQSDMLQELELQETQTTIGVAGDTA